MYIITIIIIIIIIITIYNSYYAPVNKKTKEKDCTTCLQCGNSLLNHGNISMFNRA